MKELVLDLVTCCENRISVVEELVTGAYYATATLDASLAEIIEARTRLKTSLQEILARNCSLRKKDFNTLIDRIIFESEREKRELEEERTQIKEELEGYLNEQKQLVSSLRQQLVCFTHENGDKKYLEAIIDQIKVAYQHKGQQVFTLLRDFQQRLEAFRREQEGINYKLQRLANRGKTLKLEDLRQLEAAKAEQERKVKRGLRQQEIRRLLAHFRQHRESNRHWR